MARYMDIFSYHVILIKHKHKFFKIILKIKIMKTLKFVTHYDQGL